MKGRLLFPMGRAVEITIDGQRVTAHEGEPLAAVFLRLDDTHTRLSPRTVQPRAPYCMMGVCFECVVTIESIGQVRSCQVAVRAGMKIERQDRVARLA